MGVLYIEHAERPAALPPAALQSNTGLACRKVDGEISGSGAPLILFGYFVGFIEQGSCPLSTLALGFV
jgi:hypothetical protein